MTARILCVEDNPQNLRLVRRILTSAGYEVLEAMKGSVGMEIAEQENPDLILMDVNLPDIDGLEATILLKKSPNMALTPVIALTANAMHGDRERCLEAGCSGYIAKPITKIDLLNTVAHYLEHAPAEHVPARSS